MSRIVHHEKFESLKPLFPSFGSLGVYAKGKLWLDTGKPLGFNVCEERPGKSDEDLLLMAYAYAMGKVLQALEPIDSVKKFVFEGTEYDPDEETGQLWVHNIEPKSIREYDIKSWDNLTTALKENADLPELGWLIEKLNHNVKPPTYVCINEADEGAAFVRNYFIFDENWTEPWASKDVSDGLDNLIKHAIVAHEKCECDSLRFTTGWQLSYDWCTEEPVVVFGDERWYGE
ncbi:MAG: hypothetical protein GY861_20985 [bacterium]|nr:hypothetical protein [bacterium]